MQAPEFLLELLIGSQRHGSCGCSKMERAILPTRSRVPTLRERPHTASIHDETDIPFKIRRISRYRAAKEPSHAALVEISVLLQAHSYGMRVTSRRRSPFAGFSLSTFLDARARDCRGDALRRGAQRIDQPRNVLGRLRV